MRSSGTANGISIARCKVGASACWWPIIPLGPYASPLQKPLIGGHYDSIDPTVYIDDKGQAHLYWGNPNLWSVKLNKDMISYDTSVGDNGLVRHPMTVKALGERIPTDEKRGTS